MGKKVKTFRLKYTEIIGDGMEREGEMIIETKSIKRTLEAFCSSRNVDKIQAIESYII
jgi:hypothetical protein|tara:strand:- start:863 stop:1036 length:174 start_codon:yes stop_codon:yes gene_type:complete